jgi:hypothetical protein
VGGRNERRRVRANLGFRWVGVPGLEPGTSSLSECRHFSSGSGLMAVTWAYAYSALITLPAVSCGYPRRPQRSRAVVGPSLGPVPWISAPRAGRSPLETGCMGNSCRVRVGRRVVEKQGRRAHRRGVRGGSPESMGLLAWYLRGHALLRGRVHPLAVGHPPGSGLNPWGEGGAPYRLNDLRPRGLAC